MSCRGVAGVPPRARLARRCPALHAAAMNADLHAFVHDALARGVAPEALRAALRDARWPDDEIESELAAWHDAGLGLPVPRRPLTWPA